MSPEPPPHRHYHRRPSEETDDAETSPILIDSLPPAVWAGCPCGRRHEVIVLRARLTEAAVGYGVTGLVRSGAN